MKFTPVFGAPPTVGIELEVLEWANKTELKIVKELVKAGYMPPNAFTEKQVLKNGVESYKHQYHCKCPIACKLIGTTTIVPVQWKMEYDNSLPQKGAEFISSPFPLAEGFVQQATDAYQIITEDAVWSYLKHNNFDNTAKAAAGMHVHCSMSKIETGNGGLQNMQRVFHLYYPELLAIASNRKQRRGLHYRHAVGADYDPHHYFLSYAHQPGQQPHFEWRLAEAYYNDVDYFQGIVFLFAALTQASTVDSVFKALEGVALLRSWPQMAIKQQTMEPDEILAYVDDKRLAALETVALECSALATMDEGGSVVEKLFQDTKWSLG